MDELIKHKKEIEKKIVNKALTSYGEEVISKDELKNIAEFTVDGMKAVNTRQQLLEFLKHLSEKWQFFSSIVIIEEGEYKGFIERDAYSKVLDLAKQGKIEEAINLSKSITN